MSKVDYSGLPEAGSKWEFDGITVRVASFRKKGRGGYVQYATENSIGEAKWSEWKKRAKAA